MEVSQAAAVLVASPRLCLMSLRGGCGTDSQEVEAAPLLEATFWSSDRGLALAGLDPVTSAGFETDSQKEHATLDAFFLWC